jgi:hypothetical protein
VSVTLLADPWEPTLLNEPSLLVNEPSEATETEKVESEFPVSPYEAMLRVFPAQPCAVVSRLESVTPLNRKDPALDALTNDRNGVRVTALSQAITRETPCPNSTDDPELSEILAAKVVCK